MCAARLTKERPKYAIYFGHTSVRSRTTGSPRTLGPEQLSLACLLSSACQCQRVRASVLSAIQTHSTRGSSSHPAACVSRCGSPPDFGFLFSDRLSDSVADGAWCLLRCTAGANRRHLTLTFRSLLPSEDIASGWTTVGRFPKSKQHLSFGLCWFLEAFGKNTFRLLSMRKY